MRRVLTTLLAALAVIAAAAPTAGAQLPKTGPCKYDVEDPFEKSVYRQEGWRGPDYERYPGACQRMTFSYGPIAVKPGQNDVLVGPVTIEKPIGDGYITRFKPNLVRADGSVPPVEQVHLHHGTWLSVPDYGSGPFFAAGEEKTIAPFPKGYGMPVKTTDAWALLYMVHSAVPTPMETFITYEIDFIPQAAAEEIGIKDAYPVWLDVRPSAYPVFNVQRQFGGPDKRCTWPAEQCAEFDPFGREFIGQGVPGNGTGEDLTLPERGESLGRIDDFQGGTFIGMGGHLHPGGIRNTIDLVRPGGATVKIRKSKGVVRRKRGSVRIYNGRAWYWDRKTHTRKGGPPTSWDFSMEVQGLPRWGVRVEPGDTLRSNAIYDTSHQATYENMGIVVSLLAPDTPEGKPTAPGIDPFKAKWTSPNGPWSGKRKCGPAHGTLCSTGRVTHGHYKENGNYGYAKGQWGDATPGSPTNEVAIADFLYAPGDLSTRSMIGVPQVKLGSTLRFTNLEGPAIYHTVTTCAFPCLGATGAAFPLADGKTSKGRALDLDSAELGIGVPAVGAASQRLDWNVPVTEEAGFSPVRR